jgi:hypothetical protein
LQAGCRSVAICLNFPGFYSEQTRRLTRVRGQYPVIALFPMPLGYKIERVGVYHHRHAALQHRMKQLPCPGAGAQPRPDTNRRRPAKLGFQVWQITHTPGHNFGATRDHRRYVLCARSQGNQARATAASGLRRQ